MRYVVSERALETIEHECRRSPDTETGGILAGYRDDRQVTVTHATGPGLVWEGSAHHFVKDTGYLQAVLNLLFHYFQVNYLGVWHKHPEFMPFPSAGDVASAMADIADTQVRLDELLTPICVLDSGRVRTLPFVIKDHDFAPVDWTPVPHQTLGAGHPLDTQWYTRSVGQARLVEERERLKRLGVSAEVKKGADGTYRFRVPLDPDSSLRMVMLCPNEYPVAAPQVAVYDQRSGQYEPVHSAVLDDWNIHRFLGDLVEEYRGIAPAASAAERRRTT